MMGAPEELRQYLVDQGVVVAKSAFARTAPPKPDNLVAVLVTGGPDPIRMMGGAKIYQPTFQVMVRNTDKMAGVAVAEAAWTALENTGDTNLTGADGAGNSTTARYLLIQAVGSEPIPLKPDESDRFRFGVNIRVQKEASA